MIRYRAVVYFLPRAAHARAGLSNRIYLYTSKNDKIQTHSIPTYTAAKAYLGLSIKFSMHLLSSLRSKNKSAWPSYTGVKQYNNM